MIRTRIPLVLFLALLLTLTAGCSRFKSSQRVNLAPFAEDMIQLAGDIQYGMGRLQPVHLQGYMDVKEIHDYDLLGAKLRGTLRGAISYSIQVVTLAESDHGGPKRARILADYLDGLLREVLIAPVPTLQLSVAEFDTILTDIRGSKDLLDALRAAQPVIDEISRASGELFDEAGTALEVVRSAVERRVDSDFAHVTETDRNLRDLQVKIAGDIDLLTRIWEGDVAAVDTLRVNQPSVASLMRPGVLPDEEAMFEVEKRIVYMLEAVSEVRRQMEPDLLRYREAKRELGFMKNEFAAELRRGRVAILAWARANGRLAAGVTDPAEIDILGIARKAAGQYIPL